MKSRDRRYGMTIVEVVVVIAALAIIASVAVLGYGAWQTRLAANETKADLLSAKAAMDSARNVNAASTYPSTINFTPSAHVTMTGGGTNSNVNFCIRAQSTRSSSVVYYITDQLVEPTQTACTYP